MDDINTSDSTQEKTCDLERILRKTTTHEVIEKPLSTEETSFKSTVKCSSCLERENCANPLKDTRSCAETCRKYHTRIVLIWNGNHVCFNCPVNMTYSNQYTREELDRNSTLLETIAEQLQVRNKDVWKLLLKDGLPRERELQDCPEFDLSESLSSKEKQHIRFKVAEWFMENNHVITIEESGDILVYQNGIYVPKGERLIVEAIRQALEEQCTTYDRNETIAAVRDKTLVSNKIFLRNSKHKVCVENGTLDLDTGEFAEHTPKEYFLNKIPVKYDPWAECPRIDKFISEIVDGSDIQTLEEIVAYCLYPDYPIHKAFMLVGYGANGKSTFLKLVKAFLGKENCSGISLQQLGDNRFATSAILGKYTNIHADISSKALRDTGTFKMLVGQDLIGAEIKFGKHFTFENHTKLLFSANQIPDTGDDTEAFFRRWIIITFPNKFTDEPDAEHKADHYLIQKLTTPFELSGLLKECLKRLPKLLERGSFHGDKPTAEWRIDYIRKSDPIKAFYMDRCIENNTPETYITKNDLFKAFIRYCRKNKLPPVDNNVFSRKIKANFQYAQDSTARIEGKKQRIWRCLTLIENDEDEKKINDDW